MNAYAVSHSPVQRLRGHVLSPPPPLIVHSKRILRTHTHTHLSHLVAHPFNTNRRQTTRRHTHNPHPISTSSLSAALWMEMLMCAGCKLSAVGGCAVCMMMRENCISASYIHFTFIHLEPRINAPRSRGEPHMCVCAHAHTTIIRPRGMCVWRSHVFSETRARVLRWK